MTKELAASNEGLFLSTADGWKCHVYGVGSGLHASPNLVFAVFNSHCCCVVLLWTFSCCCVSFLNVQKAVRCFLDLMCSVYCDKYSDT